MLQSIAIFPPVKTTATIFVGLIILLSPFSLLAQNAESTSCLLLHQEVTASDYCNFLNRVSTDFFYNEKMTSDPLGACIARTGTPESYEYFVIAGKENAPITYVTQSAQTAYINESEAYSIFNGEKNFSASLTSNQNDFWVNMMPGSILAMNGLSSIDTPENTPDILLESDVFFIWLASFAGFHELHKPAETEVVENRSSHHTGIIHNEEILPEQQRAVSPILLRPVSKDEIQRNIFQTSVSAKLYGHLEAEAAKIGHEGVEGRVWNAASYFMKKAAMCSEKVVSLSQHLLSPKFPNDRETILYLHKAVLHVMTASDYYTQAAYDIEDNMDSSAHRASSRTAQIHFNIAHCLSNIASYKANERRTFAKGMTAAAALWHQAAEKAESACLYNTQLLQTNDWREEERLGKLFCAENLSAKRLVEAAEAAEAENTIAP